MKTPKIASDSAAPAPSAPTISYADYIGNLQSIASASTMDDLADAFLGSVKGLGFTSVIAFTRLAHQWPDGRGHLLFERAPPGFMAQYEQQRFWSEDPTILYAQRTVDPFTWSQALASHDTPGARRLYATAAQFGLVDGLVLQLIGADGRRLLVSVAGAAPGMDVASFAAVEMFAHAMRRRADAIRSAAGSGPQRMELTSREIEVLTLISYGATDKQVAAQLGIHERTVGKHATKILEKLSCRSRAEAVAQALRQGLMT